MNWLQMLMRIMGLAPIIVAGIEQIHQDASGATKKQMAMDALATATGVASAVAPEHQAAIAASSQLASNMIDGLVATFNAAGIFQKKDGTSGAAAPVAPSLAPRQQVHS